MNGLAKSDGDCAEDEDACYHQRTVFGPKFRKTCVPFMQYRGRTLLLFALFTPIPFLDLYRLSAWLPWIRQLVLAQWIIQSANGQAISTPSLVTSLVQK